MEQIKYFCGNGQETVIGEVNEWLAKNYGRIEIIHRYLSFGDGDQVKIAIWYKQVNGGR